jgi:transposase-like protein
MNEASVMKEIPAQRRARDSDCMGGLRQGSTTFEELRTQAIGLRREGLSRRQIRDRLKVGNNDLLNRLLKGEPAPEWTKRPRAKDGMKAKARAFRLEGWTYDQIEMELGVSRSSISLWVRDPPKPTPRTREERRPSPSEAGKSRYGNGKKSGNGSKPALRKKSTTSAIANCS